MRCNGVICGNDCNERVFKDRGKVQIVMWIRLSTEAKISLAIKYALDKLQRKFVQDLNFNGRMIFRKRSNYFG